jgi:hypothetical protein
MRDDETPDSIEDSSEETPAPPTIESDDGGGGLGVGGNIASIRYDFEHDVRAEGIKPARRDDDDDPGAGLGTGGEVKAPPG